MKKIAANRNYRGLAKRAQSRLRGLDVPALPEATQHPPVMEYSHPDGNPRYGPRKGGGDPGVHEGLEGVSGGGDQSWDAEKWPAQAKALQTTIAELMEVRATLTRAFQTADHLGAEQGGVEGSFPGPYTNSPLHVPAKDYIAQSLARLNQAIRVFQRQLSMGADNKYIRDDLLDY